MTDKMKMTLKKILSPYNMGLEDIQNPGFKDIDLLIGNDNASLQLKEHQALNGLSRPGNLIFKHSPVLRRPVAIGRIYGHQEWTKEQLVDSMKKDEIKIPDEKPEKEWIGFKKLRSVEDIRKEKENTEWSNEVNEDQMEEIEAYLASTEEENIEYDTNMAKSYAETSDKEEDDH